MNKAMTISNSLDVAKQRIILNVSSNVFVIVLGIGINLALTPYLIRRLGIAAYGIVGLANTLPPYVQLITQSISNSLFRHISVNVHGGRPDLANLYFNTAFKSLLWISILLLIPVGLVGAFASRLFNMPADMQSQCSWLILLVLLGCLAGTITTPFIAVYQLTHHFFLQNLMQTAGKISGLCILVTCFCVWPASPLYVGLYNLVMISVSSFLLIGFQFKIQNIFRVQLRLFSWKAVGEMLRMGGYLFINDLSVLLFMTVSMIMMNRTLGATACGYFSPILLLSSLLMTIGGAIGSVLMPVLYQYVSLGDMEQLRGRTFQIMRIQGVIIAIPLILLCGLARPLLSLWLGVDFVFLWPLLWMVLIALYLGGILFIPLSYVYRGLNLVRFPALINLGFGVLHLLLMYILFVKTKFNVFGFGISFVVTVGLRGIILNGLYCDYVMHLKWGTCWIKLMPIMITTVSLSLLCLAITPYTLTVPLLLLEGVTGAALCTILFVRVLLTQSDREILFELIPKTFISFLRRII